MARICLLLTLVGSTGCVAPSPGLGDRMARTMSPTVKIEVNSPDLTVSHPRVEARVSLSFNSSHRP